jgi:CheY-like chemotaxis protein
MENGLKILLIEDSAADAELIREMLGEDSGSSFELTWANSVLTGQSMYRHKREKKEFLGRAKQ